jgi:hypothetical protein
VDRSTESSAEKEDVWKGKPAPPVDFENFWEAPEALWKPKEWSEREIEAVMVSPFSSVVYASMELGWRYHRPFRALALCLCLKLCLLSLTDDQSGGATEL